MLGIAIVVVKVAVKVVKASKKARKAAKSAGKSAAKNGCNCFTAGTKVLTDEGEKNIEDIEVGDRVLAKDENNLNCMLESKSLRRPITIRFGCKVKGGSSQMNFKWAINFKRLMEAT
ncbi:Hint domain-containing protein [Paenibacillus curdlanolyticus]|uniref:Hint domain-containing protein n=1 Tax=Paenibacillus curdlanolyticus TaxID=59840 RepID=UPI00059385FC|nr:Hint domain-containing protein [Paenibacillus curdlanolyticus]